MANRVAVAVYRPDRLQVPSADNALLGVYDDAGNELALVRNRDDAYFVANALAVAADGSIYVAGYTTPPAEFFFDTSNTPAVRKYHRDGTLLWGVNPGRWVNALAIDPTTGDLLMTGPQNAAGDTTHRYSAAGAWLHSFDNGLVEDWDWLETQGAYGCIAVDAAGSLYTAVAQPGAYAPDYSAYYLYTGKLTKWTSAGVKIWEYWHHGPPKSLVVDDAHGVLYYGVKFAYFDDQLVSLLKLDIDDGQVLAATTSGIPPVNNPANERLVLVGSVLYGIGYAAYAQYDLDLTRLTTWVVNIDDLAVDTDGHHYYATSSHGSSNPGTAGDLVVHVDYGWTATPLFEINHPQVDCTCVAVIEAPELHGLCVPLAWAAPLTQGDRYVLLTAALPLPWILPPPRGILEVTGTVTPQTVYRLSVRGASLAPLVLPMSSFQVRRTAGSTTLSAVCPQVSSAQLAELAARHPATLVIEQGFRLNRGEPVWAELARGAVTALRSDVGPQRASLSVSALDAAVPLSGQTRRVQNVNYENLTQGRRRIRCAADPYLMVGDWADLGGGDGLTVGELVYTIDIQSASMEIVAAAGD